MIARSPQNRAVRRASRVKGERIIHNGTPWTLYSLTGLPRRGGTCALFGKFDDRVVQLEWLGSADRCDRLAHRATVRAAVWARQLDDATLLVGVARVPLQSRVGRSWDLRTPYTLNDAEGRVLKRVVDQSDPRFREYLHTSRCRIAN